MRTGRWISRARPRRSSAHTASSRRSCPITNAEWEKLSIFLNFLIPKLPAPKEEDLSKGILEAIDMDSYRVEEQAAHGDRTGRTQNAEIEPVPPAAAAASRSRNWTGCRNIVRGVQRPVRRTSTGRTRTRSGKLITEEIPAKVAADKAYQNAMKNSDKQNARIEHDKALKRVITALFTDDAELFKQFRTMNPSAAG